MLKSKKKRRAKARVYERMNARHKWMWSAIIGMPRKEKETTEPEQKFELLVNVLL